MEDLRDGVLSNEINNETIKGKNAAAEIYNNHCEEETIKPESI